MKFRKKPVVIEAVQLTKELRNNMGPFPEWALPHLDASRTEKIDNSEEIYINNPSGKLRVFDGDWIIRGTKEGDVYPCPDDVFKATYDVEPASGTKDLGITEVRGAKANISDLVVYGDGDTFALLCKASSKDQGWMKSTKVANVPSGCIVQVTTQQKNPDGSYAVAEALTFVPDVNIDVKSDPRRLVKVGVVE